MELQFLETNGHAAGKLANTEVRGLSTDQTQEASHTHKQEGMLRVSEGQSFEKLPYHLQAVSCAPGLGLGSYHPCWGGLWCHSCL